MPIREKRIVHISDITFIRGSHYGVDSNHISELRIKFLFCTRFIKFNFSQLKIYTTS